MKSVKLAGYEKTLIVSEPGCQIKKRGDNICYIQVGSEIQFDQGIFDGFGDAGWESIHHDLLVLAAAVEYADRNWGRTSDSWSRNLHLVVPVLELHRWESAPLQSTLVSALNKLTGDQWFISFVGWKGEPMNQHRIQRFNFNERKSVAIPYSDGLDSYCLSQLYGRNDTAIHVRVSKNRDKVKEHETPFDRLPFSVSIVQPRESSVRSRGFKFSAITAIAAHLSGIKDVLIPESGQGALGPVLVPLRNVYPDYRNHPVFLRKMERFVSMLLRTTIEYRQPRIWSTKGETISACLDQGIVPDSLVATRSCWQTRHNVHAGGTYRQCGLCAACLLRRMSLLSAGIEEPENSYVIEDLTPPNYRDAYQGIENFEPTETLAQYGQIGVRHLDRLAHLAAASDEELMPYSFDISQSTQLSLEESHQNLRGMLSRHADEWNDFLTHCGEGSFLRNWLVGDCS